MKILLLFFVMFAALNVNAKEYKCPVEKEKIISRLQQVPTCFKDEECRYFDYGYPFQPNVCMKAIVSTQQEGKTITDLRLISDYNQNCVFNTQEGKNNFEQFEESKTLVKCKQPARLFCLKGKCRTQGYVAFDQPDAVIRIRNNKIDDATAEDIMKIKSIKPLTSEKKE
ncbi:MAG TPA: hypothetical protein DIV86_02360 [Alphaproteobacteria bacterium]|nr:hypothetical protein [Alphaproteobacteria bacterium]